MHWTSPRCINTNKYIKKVAYFDISFVKLKQYHAELIKTTL